MSPTQPIETIASQVYTLDREQCIRELQSFEAFPLDFTAQCLRQMSLEKLRHVLMAAMITARRVQ